MHAQVSELAALASGQAESADAAAAAPVAHAARAPARFPVTDASAEALALPSAQILIIPRQAALPRPRRERALGDDLTSIQSQPVPSVGKDIKMVASPASRYLHFPGRRWTPSRGGKERWKMTR